MRTTPQECRRLGEIMAEKLNASTGPVTVLIPLKGISVISAQGQAFYDADADKALFDALKSKLRAGIEVHELDCNINDAQFAEACVTALLGKLQSDR